MLLKSFYILASNNPAAYHFSVGGEQIPSFSLGVSPIEITAFFLLGI